MTEEHQKLHDALRDDLFKRQISNSEMLAKAILSLSSAGIGVSLLFLKSKNEQDAVNLVNVNFLHWSWVGFLSAIICTLVSFFVSQYAILRQLKLNRLYYLEGREEVIKKKNYLNWGTFFLDHLSVAFYIGSVYFMVKFLMKNLIGG